MSSAMLTTRFPGGEPSPTQPRKLSVPQYHRMVQAGVLKETDRVELLEGRIVPKMTHNPPHDACVSLTHAELFARIPTGWMLRVQSAITLDNSEPEPDIAVAKAPARRYVRTHPRRKDSGMLVEVADTSLVDDRNVKGPLFARNRIPVYWIVNLLESTIEVYSQPKGGKNPHYAERRDYGIDEFVPLIIAGKRIGEIAVRDILP